MTEGKSPPSHPADRLLAAIEAKRAPVCVGIDPVVEKLPRAIVPEYVEGSFLASALDDFCTQVEEAIAPHVPCVKYQMACFERYLTSGWATLVNHIATCRIPDDNDFKIILDAKRGDVGVSAEHYAQAYFEEVPLEDSLDEIDWLTINSYLGEDGITPFLKHEGHGAFALVRTSNPGGDAIQNLQLKDGRTVAEAVGAMIAKIGRDYVGERGYSSLGAVVGATKPQDAKRLREIMPQQMFLVPGYGAQGGGVDDVLPCFKSDGTGAIVTASRSVIYAFDPKDPKWMNSVADAAAKFADEVGRAVGMR